MNIYNRFRNTRGAWITRLPVISLIAVFFLVAASSAHALSIDYANMANTSPGEGGYSSFTPAPIGGISVTATGTNIAGTADYYAYLDSNFDGRLGGLGVCKDLVGSPNVDGSDCDPSSDDNVTAGERLTVEFSEEVNISEILFRDGLHYDTFKYKDNDFDLYIDDILDGTYDLVHSFTTPLTGTKFSFIASYGDTDLDEFYIEMITFAAVPEPSTYLLLGSGMLGLVFWRRKRLKG